MASSLNNLAGLYKAQGRYEQANPLYQRSLAIKEQVLGQDHPDVATSLNNLALVYQEQGRYEQAEEAYIRAMKILNESFQKGHKKIDVIQKNYDGLKQKMESQ